MEKSFLRTLFSNDFNSFISVKVVSVVYFIGMGFIGLGGLLGVLTGLTQGEFLIAVVALPIAFLTLMIWRVICESSIALIKVAENTSR